MTAPLFNPEVEEVTLYTALTKLLDTWGTSGMAEAFSDLCAAMARARRALSVLEMHSDQRPAWRVHRAGLSTLTVWADWDARIAKHPEDTELQVLHALWIRLCVKVERGDLALEDAIAAFENARETLIQKHWEERQEKQAPAGT